MDVSVSIQGFIPAELNYCPKCGEDGFPQTVYYYDGKVECGVCGFSCYIIEAE